MPQPNQYEIDNRVTVSALFKVSGTPTDPTSITLTIKKPDGTSSTPTPTKTGTGAYSHDIDVTQFGIWYYTFKGTGACVASSQRYFEVLPNE